MSTELQLKMMKVYREQLSVPCNTKQECVIHCQKTSQMFIQLAQARHRLHTNTMDPHAMHTVTT